MSSEIASKRIAQREDGTEHDQDAVNPKTKVVIDVAGDLSARYSSQIEASEPLWECGQHVESAIPAMKGGKAVPDVRNQLKRSDNSNHTGEQNMHGKGGIAHGFARDVPMDKDVTPSLKIPTQRRKTIERRNTKCERELAADGQHKPKPCCRFQRGIPNGIQFRRLGPYSCAHSRFS